MFSGLKNFAIDKILRHVAENPKLNHATNVLAIAPVVILAALNGGANWALMMQCCGKPGSLHEVLRVAGLAIMAAMLWLTGKAGWLKGWLPTVGDVIAEAEKEIEQSASVVGLKGKQTCTKTVGLEK